MKETVSTPKEVSNAMREDFRSKGLSIAEVARRIGKSPQNMTNILRGDRRMSQSTAELLNREFGYSIPYMRFGTGSLLGEIGENGPYDYDKSIQSLVYNLGYVFPLNTKGLTEREKEWNRIACVFKSVFFILDKEISIGLTLDMDKALDRPFTHVAVTPKEKTLEASLLLFTGLIKQIADIEPILKHFAEMPNK